jgi:PKD repeat protein
MIKKFVVLLLSVIFLVSPFTVSLSAATDIIYLGNSTVSNVTINGINANATSGPAPLNVQFTSKVTGKASNYLWIIESQNKNYYSSLPMKAKFTFLTPGVYSVSLIVSGAKGHSSMTKANYITVKAPISNANFTATHKLKSPLTVNFIGSVSSGTAVRYAWSFGDGKTATGKNVIHVYHTAGLYPVNEVVYLKNGTTVTKTKCLILTK